MLLQNNKAILSYSLNEEEKSNISEILNYNCKVVEQSMGKMKIKDILDGLKLEVINSQIPKEKLILFNNFEDEELKKTINLIKSVIQPAPIFAIVTETSIDWTFEHLLEHLIEEREWYRNHSR
jgi:hypothetical protein